MFALFSIYTHNGGLLHPEMYIRLPYYLTEKPLLNKLFDSKIVDMDMYQARELSYVLDFIDSKFVEFSIRNGFPHFLSLTHYVFSIATGCILWFFCTDELKIKPLLGLSLLTLFWTSPSVFLGGDIFRTSKVGVSLLVVILLYVIYKVIKVSKKRSAVNVSKKIWFLYFIAFFTMPFLDEQGLFLNITTLVLLTIWWIAFRDGNISRMLKIGVVCLLVHELYRYVIAPQLTYALNGYWPNFSYQELPILDFVQNLILYLSSGLFLYIETFRFLIGNPPRLVGASILLFFISFPVLYLYYRQGLSANDKKFFGLVLVELLISNLFMVVIMNALMVLRHPQLMWPDVSRVYYWLPTNVILAMTLAMLIRIFHDSGIPMWLLLMAMGFAILGNIVALPRHKTMLMQGHLQWYYQSSPALLNALKNLDLIDNVHEPLVEKNPVLQLFLTPKSIKHN